MSNLLRVLRMNPKNAAKGKNRPLWSECPVNPETAPYLVTSEKSGVLWVEEPNAEGMVRAGVRPVITPGLIFAEMLAALIERGVRDQWGTVHPYTEAGLRAAVKHVEEYGIEDLEVLVPRQRAEGDPAGLLKRPDWLKDVLVDLELPPRMTSWLPDNCAVVLPRDRDFVGLMGYVSAKHVMGLIHNASRGVAIACRPA